MDTEVVETHFSLLLRTLREQGSLSYIIQLGPALSMVAEDQSH